MQYDVFGEMIGEEQIRWINQRAKVPEHSVGLMAGLFRGEPFIEGRYFGCVKGSWVLVIGFLLEGEPEPAELGDALERIIHRLGPGRISLIAPRLPEKLPGMVVERGRDSYYTLDLDGHETPGRLKRVVRKTREQARVKRSRSMGPAHEELTAEFLARVDPPERVRNLYLRIPGWVHNSATAKVLNAYDGQGDLTAFYVLDLAPALFSSYIVGAHSKTRYMPGASDLLFQEMIDLSLEEGKKTVNLGLGVNPGLRRFKAKWGGRPTMDYEMVELSLTKKFSLSHILGYARARAG